MLSSNADNGPLDLEAWFAVLLPILYRHRSGLSEHDLMKVLATMGYEQFATAARGDALSLFQAHFTLFHVLYRLRDGLLAQGEAELQIDCRNIVLLPYTPSQQGGSSVAAIDPLREYYLDLSQLAQTQADDVEQLLSGFWRKVQSSERRQWALQILGLAEDADFVSVRRRYRSLAMQHHPDRGGDTERLQMLNEAMAVLRDCHKGNG